MNKAINCNLWRFKLARSSFIWISLNHYHYWNTVYVLLESVVGICWILSIMFIQMIGCEWRPCLNFVVVVICFISFTVLFNIWWDFRLSNLKILNFRRSRTLDKPSNCWTSSIFFFSLLKLCFRVTCFKKYYY